MNEAQLLTTTIGFVVIVLLPTITYLVKRQIDQLQAQVTDGLRTESLERGAMARALRSEISEVGRMHAALQREVDKEYVNYDRLNHAFLPVNKALEEIKADQKRLFERLDGKQDKPGGHHD